MSEDIKSCEKCQYWECGNNEGHGWCSKEEETTWGSQTCDCYSKKRCKWCKLSVEFDTSRPHKNIDGSYEDMLHATIIQILIDKCECDG